MELTNEQCAEPARREEIAARAKGLFEVAVAYQMQADLIEETGYYLPMCSWLKHGVERRPKYWVHDQLIGLQASTGAMLWLTQDAAEDAVAVLLEWLGWAPRDKDWRLIVESTPRGQPFSEEAEQLLKKFTNMK